MVWNQDKSLDCIVASAVDRRYLRVSVHGCDGSDRLRLINIVACGSGGKSRKVECATEREGMTAGCKPGQMTEVER